MDLFVAAATTLTCFILALFVYLKNQRSATNIYFSLLIFFLGLYPVFNFFVLISKDGQEALFWTKLVVLSAAPAGPLFYFFVKTFPDIKSLVDKKILFLFSLWATVNIVLGFLGLVFKSVDITQGQLQLQPGSLIISFASLQILSIALGSWILFKKYREARGYLKLQLKIITFGIFISFSLTLLSTMILPLLFKETFYISISPVFLLIAGGSVAYSIVKHRLLDIRLILARTVSFTALVILFAFFYSVLISSLSAFASGIPVTAKAVAVSTMLALIMAFSFQPMRRFLERITDKIAYKDKYESSKLLYDLAIVMASTLRLEDMTHQILNIILPQMRISKGAFILAEDDIVYDVAHEGFGDFPVIDEGKTLSLMYKNKTLVADDMEGKEKELMDSMGFSAVLPLETEGQFLGLLCLGNKLSGDPYTVEDIKVLEILAPEFAVAIQNAKAYEEIRRFNITLQAEVEQATKELRAANIKLKELDKLKDDFVSVASHELRTPMTAIRSYAWMALNRSDVALSDKLKKYLARTLLSTERLIGLVNDMLNISRIESGRIEVIPKEFDIQALVEDVLVEVEGKALEKNIRFEMVKSEITDVFADQDKVRQILLNLLGNALKFTQNGGVVKLSFFSDAKTAEISVIDTGVGITQEDLPKLFSKFSRLDSSYVTSQSSGGTGLGLYIAKSLTELMGGKIWASSEGLDKGATFTFSLPLAKEDIVMNAKRYTHTAKGEIKTLEPVAI